MRQSSIEEQYKVLIALLVVILSDLFETHYHSCNNSNGILYCTLQDHIAVALSDQGKMSQLKKL